jgi:hypothetical protein
MTKRTPTGDAVNQTSFEVANLIYDLAALFPYSVSFEPLEQLARDVQKQVIHVGAQALRDHVKVGHER